MNLRLLAAAKDRRSALALAFALFGCHHTWQGVKEDTRNAVHETGRGLEKAGKKLQGSGEHQHGGDAGTPASQH